MMRLSYILPVFVQFVDDNDLKSCQTAWLMQNSGVSLMYQQLRKHLLKDFCSGQSKNLIARSFTVLPTVAVKLKTELSSLRLRLQSGMLIEPSKRGVKMKKTGLSCDYRTYFKVSPGMKYAQRPPVFQFNLPPSLGGMLKDRHFHICKISNRLQSLFA